MLVAIISTAGLHKRGDRPFRPGDGSYRVIPAETAANELVMLGVMPIVLLALLADHFFKALGTLLETPAA